MRHRKKNNHLSRTSAHRGAMLSNMATSLIMHKRIYTTVPKAKELRKFVEPIISVSKEDTTTARRNAFSKLKNKYAVTELFQIVSQKVGDRPGGYTRIIKTGARLGDNASMCFIELVDFNENMLSDSATKKTRTRRSRRRGGGGATATTEGATPTAKAKESATTETASAEDKVTKSKGDSKVKDTKDKAKVEAKEEPKAEAKEVVKEEPKAAEAQEKNIKEAPEAKEADAIVEGENKETENKETESRDEKEA